jgi:hypothetical protein
MDPCLRRDDCKRFRRARPAGGGAPARSSQVAPTQAPSANTQFTATAESRHSSSIVGASHSLPNIAANTTAATPNKPTSTRVRSRSNGESGSSTCIGAATPACAMRAICAAKSSAAHRATVARSACDTLR